MGKHSQYGVILDAGSSGTRIYIYKWKHPTRALKHASTADKHRLPKLKLKNSKKIHPGVSTFGNNVASVGPDHLESLVKFAISEIPASKIPKTPVFLMATAGVRFLPKLQQTSLLQGICNYLRASTDFHLPDCKTHIQVISGETEGLYGWIAANYLLGGFDRPEEHAHGKGHHTYGFLDMGGASAQIAFAPNATETAKHANDLKLVRLRRLDGSSAEYRVFTTTWLGFGANKARSRFVESLQDNYGKSVHEIPDPCMPKGLRTSLDGQSLTGTSVHDQVLVGTGAFEECLRKTYPLLRKEVPCKDHPCLLNGQHVPVIDFDVNHFVGVSEYWHTTHGVFGKEDAAYDVVKYQQAVMDYCNRDWGVIVASLKRTGKKAERKSQEAREACFKASWLINMIHDGIGIPRLALDGTPIPSPNNTHLEKTKTNAKGKGTIDPFRPVDKVDGVEVSWTLGKMVLYAAGQISPKEDSAPVGFGSNVDSNMPPDFEHAGSLPLSPAPSNDFDDSDDSLSGLRKSTSGFLAVAVIILLAVYWLRRPESRRWLSGWRWRRRPGPGRKAARGGLSLVTQLLSRSPGAYERVADEPDPAELELGQVDLDDRDNSDSSESSRFSPYPAITTPKINYDRAEDLRPPSEMDRNGHVIRTESRERLTPTLQMLNAGRRSRGGSPTRMKSPLMTPLDD
ncbi:hypothetical protein HIM_00873 [Hirsutella minnesotensis 3608]|nr:hypothetical protein HIM_00873 [Hirsutella minnesotensis 3608]